MAATATRPVHESPAEVSDAVLVAGLRRGDPAAIHTFMERYASLLTRYARASFRWEPEPETLALDTLADVVVSLAGGSALAPVNLTGYVLSACRHRLANAQRARQRNAERLGLNEPTTAWVPCGVSEFTLRACGRLSEEDAVARAILPTLTDSERQLLTWVAERVPQSEIAAWLGISDAATRKRLHRLRIRLRATVR